MREIDLRPFHLPQYIIIFSTKGRNILLSAGWMFFVSHFIIKIRASLREYRAILKDLAGIYFIFGCLFYIFAWPFDEGIFRLNKNTNNFIEELLENIGAFLFVLSAYHFKR